MTRDEAQLLLAQTPEYIQGPCPWCGATTIEEAGTKCRPIGLPSGDYECGTPDGGPNLDLEDTGPLWQRNPVYDELDSYLLGWQVLDEGLTKNPPVWRDGK